MSRLEYTIPPQTHKSFPVKINTNGGVLYLRVDYDDVGHEETRAMLKAVEKAVDDGWGQEFYMKQKKLEWKKRWGEDEDLRDEYQNNFELFCKDFAID